MRANSYMYLFLIYLKLHTFFSFHFFFFCQKRFFKCDRDSVKRKKKCRDAVGISLKSDLLPSNFFSDIKNYKGIQYAMETY